jgi:putative OPT family oligopeptide transporter
MVRAHPTRGEDVSDIVAPLPSRSDAARELTLRGLILGVLITTVFTAANVYLGLRVGLTFASSIPAAVISMAVLRALRGATIWENNIVQTVASAAGTLSSVIFVLPGLVMVGWWNGFPFWMSFGTCALGGVLGVMYTVPLRRAMVTNSTLPYPEGVAAAEVLRVGAGHSDADTAGEARLGIFALLIGSIASAATAAIVAGKVFADEVDLFFRPTATSATGIGGAMSLALFGVGHLVGLAVGLAMLVGLVISWGVATPWLTALHPIAGPAAAAAQTVWTHQVRLIGAGAIGAASVWTLATLVGPVVGGLQASLRASRLVAAGEGGSLPRSERDLPLPIVGIVSLACLPPIAVLLFLFLRGTALDPIAAPLIIAGVIYIVLAGFLVAAVCGAMAGLIGSSNSPISGLCILSVLGAAVLLNLLARAHVGAAAAPALVAFTLFVTAVVECVATIANDNLQDLKTGQLVDATPWKQQVALVVGVFAGAAVIPPILDLMNHAFGFAGANNHAISAVPLPAPQATLISTLARGVIQGNLDWGLLALGAAVGVVLVIADEGLRRMTRRMSLPPLAVALAIYLPSAVTTPLIAGAVIGYFYNRCAGRQGGELGEIRRRLGVLIASGLIVGESLFQVAIAGLIVATNSAAPMAIVGPGFSPFADGLALVAFFAIPLTLYAIVWRRAGSLA